MSVEKYAQALLALPNCELVVATLGEVGSRAYTRGASAKVGICPAPVFGDTVGVGSGFMAGILTALTEIDAIRPGQLRGLGGDELARLLNLGATVAGLVCAKTGYHSPTRTEIDAALG